MLWVDIFTGLLFTGMAFVDYPTLQSEIFCTVPSSLRLQLSTLFDFCPSSRNAPIYQVVNVLTLSPPDWIDAQKV